jgi:hypothetical protein
LQQQTKYQNHLQKHEQQSQVQEQSQHLSLPKQHLKQLKQILIAASGIEITNAIIVDSLIPCDIVLPAKEIYPSSMSKIITTVFING